MRVRLLRREFMRIAIFTDTFLPQVNGVVNTKATRRLSWIGGDRVYLYHSGTKKGGGYSLQYGNVFQHTLYSISWVPFYHSEHAEAEQADVWFSAGGHLHDDRIQHGIVWSNLWKEAWNPGHLQLFYEFHYDFESLQARRFWKSIGYALSYHSKQNTSKIDLQKLSGDLSTMTDLLRAAMSNAGIQ